MSTDSHPNPESPEWDNPDVCPFCGADLVDGGGGFMDHVDTAETCRERFEAWLDNIRDDIGSEWGG
jgi:hypothetical protein